MVEPLIAVYDACVLYPNFLRDFLIRLAIHGRAQGVLRVRWTGRIHREWMAAVLRHRPELRDALQRTRQLMDRHVLGCRVRGYERWEHRLTLPDANDRHVLAAALACVADVIVTFNTADFPEATLRPFGIVAVAGCFRVPIAGNGPRCLGRRRSPRFVETTASVRKRISGRSRPESIGCDSGGACRRTDLIWKRSAQLREGSELVPHPA